MDAIKNVQQLLNMPASVQADFQGTAAAYDSMGTNLVILIFAALVAVYIVLGILYESFIHPLTILSTLPSAGVGALLALRLRKSMSHRLKAVALVTGCKPCSGQRPARCFPHQAGCKK